MSDGKPIFFMFTVLPFSLSSAPYIFTKLFRPLVKHWESEGILNGNLVISTKLKCKLATVASYKADVSSVSPSL